MSNLYFSGQGRVLMAPRLADGTPGKFRWVGNVPELTLSPERTTREHKESYTGQRAVDLRLTEELNLGLRAVVESFTPENLALGLYGESIATAADTAHAMSIPTLEVGGIYALEHMGISNLAIVDSTDPTPVALDPYDEVTEAGHYRLNAEHGSIEIMALPVSTEAPFPVTYDHAAQTNLAIFKTAPPERFVRFEGLNTADSNSPVLIEIYRFEADPFSEVGFIQDEEAQMPMEGAALVDSTRPVDALLGQFGRIVTLA